MGAIVRIPTPLQKLTEGKSEIEVEGKNVKEIINNLEKKFPGIHERLYDEKGSVRRFLNIYVNEEDVRFLQMDETPVNPGDEISIIPAIAGGQEVNLGGIDVKIK